MDVHGHELGLAALTYAPARKAVHRMLKSSLQAVKEHHQASARDERMGGCFPQPAAGAPDGDTAHIGADGMVVPYTRLGAGVAGPIDPLHRMPIGSRASFSHMAVAIERVAHVFDTVSPFGPSHHFTDPIAPANVVTHFLEEKANFASTVAEAERL